MTARRRGPAVRGEAGPVRAGRARPMLAGRGRRFRLAGWLGVSVLEQQRAGAVLARSVVQARRGGIVVR